MFDTIGGPRNMYFFVLKFTFHVGGTYGPVVSSVSVAGYERRRFDIVAATTAKEMVSNKVKMNVTMWMV